MSVIATAQRIPRPKNLKDIHKKWLFMHFGIATLFGIVTTTALKYLHINPRIKREEEFYKYALNSVNNLLSY